MALAAMLAFVTRRADADLDDDGSHSVFVADSLGLLWRDFCGVAAGESDSISDIHRISDWHSDLACRIFFAVARPSFGNGFVLGGRSNPWLGFLLFRISVRHGFTQLRLLPRPRSRRYTWDDCCVGDSSAKKVARSVAADRGNSCLLSLLWCGSAL